MNYIKFFAVGIAAALLILGTSFVTSYFKDVKYNKLLITYNDLKNTPPKTTIGIPDTVYLPGEKIFVKGKIPATVDEASQIAFADSSFNVTTDQYISNLYAQYDLKRKLFYFDQNIEVKQKLITRVDTLTKTIAIVTEVEKPKTFFRRFNISLYTGYGYSIKAKQPDASVGLALTFSLF
ncbi:MAG: hypothetical protein WC139_06985 [Candidatus Kapaibacterium sp.]